MIERDDNIPPLDELLAELDRRGTSPPRNWIIAWRRIYEPLHRAQTEFQKLPAAAGLPDRGPTSSATSAWMRTGGWTSAADVYRLRLTEALEGDFVALQAYVGPGRFDEIARAYIGPILRNIFSLRYYGQRLARFPADTAPYRNEPPLAELATGDCG